MQKLGQHFLINKQVLKKIAGLLEPKNGDIIFEIGPGHGELTEEIRNQASNARIIAIEKDLGLAEGLREKFSEDKNFEVIEGDVLKILPSIIHDSSFKNHNYKLIGNIPYYITGKLLRTIGELTRKPDIFVLTIQKEVAGRLAAEPPQMNRLAASIQFWAKIKIAFVLPKNYFNPAPKVDSATVILTALEPEKTGGDDYYKMMKAIFSQPRKTILNNISDNLGIPKKETEAGLKKTGIDPNLRPQNLSVENIIELASVFGSDI